MKRCRACELLKPLDEYHLWIAVTDVRCGARSVVGSTTARISARNRSTLTGAQCRETTAGERAEQRVVKSDDGGRTAGQSSSPRAMTDRDPAVTPTSEERAVIGGPRTHSTRALVADDEKEP